MNEIIKNDDQKGAKTTALKTARQLKTIKNFSKLVIIKYIIETFEVLVIHH